MSTWDRRNRRAWEIGYENASQRQRIRDVAARGDLEDSDELRQLITDREEEGDFASIGEIFKDVYDRMGLEPDDDEQIAFLRGIFSPSAV
jgi:hypothetical protein